MRRICAVDVVRRAEAAAGVPEPVLMQRAATALAGVCRELLAGRRTGVRGAHVVALVGSGNNGGDALWALSFLAQRGARTTVIGDPGRMHADGARAARAAGSRVLEWGDPTAADEIRAADLVLDGILGIGGRGGVREPAAAMVEVLGTSRVPVVAVDVPSGVDPDSGGVVGVAVRATVTVCFGVLKAGLVLSPGRDLAGTVTVVDIGLSDADLEPLAGALTLADLAVEPLGPDAHKYTRGVVGVVAGCAAYPGAALLAVAGARMAGAGLVAFSPGLPGSSRSEQVRPAATEGMDAVGGLVVARYPDVVLADDRPVDARCIGPGLGPVRDVADRVLAAMGDPAPLVVDASALAVLARQDGREALAHRTRSGSVTVLTPHTGEFVRLGFDTSGGPLVAARRAAQETGAVVVLKGPGTVIAAPGAAYIDTFGDPSLATAGSGDVLAGLVAGLLARAARSADQTPATAALITARAVGLHGLAGRLAAARGGPVTSPDVVEHLRQAHAAAASART